MSRKLAIARLNMMRGYSSEAIAKKIAKPRLPFTMEQARRRYLLKRLGIAI